MSRPRHLTQQEEHELARRAVQLARHLTTLQETERALRAAVSDLEKRLAAAEHLAATYRPVGGEAGLAHDLVVETERRLGLLSEKEAAEAIRRAERAWRLSQPLRVRDVLFYALLAAILVVVAFGSIIAVVGFIMPQSSAGVLLKACVLWLGHLAARLPSWSVSVSWGS